MTVQAAVMMLIGGVKIGGGGGDWLTLDSLSLTLDNDLLF